MENFISEINKVRSLLNQGNLTEVESALQRIEAEKSSHQRWKNHYIGILLMRRGLYSDAIVHFHNTLNQHGNHISVILDLAACYYLTGQIFDWLRIVELAQYEYKKSEPLLEPDRKMRSKLLMAKFLEETGKISESLNYYLELAEKLKSNSLSATITPTEVKAAAQIVRLAAQYKINTHSLYFYNMLIRHVAQSTHFDCDFETQHALMLYELQFIDVHAAYARYSKICKNPLADSAEIIWVQNDFIFELYIKNETATLEKVFSQIDASAYDKLTSILQKILRKENISDEDYNDYVTQMTPAAQGRLLKMLAKTQNDRLLLIKQKTFIDTFERDSKTIWKNFLELNISVINTATEADSTTLILSQNSIGIANTSSSVRITENAFSILELFINKEKLNLDEAFQKLWSAEGNENDIARLRMRVNRINALLLGELGLKKVIKLTKQGLEISYPLKKIS